jgi:hypothetical protein
VDGTIRNPTVPWGTNGKRWDHHHKATANSWQKLLARRKHVDGSIGGWGAKSDPLCVTQVCEGNPPDLRVKARFESSTNVPDAKVS